MADKLNKRQEAFFDELVINGGGNVAKVPELANVAEGKQKTPARLY